MEKKPFYETTSVDFLEDLEAAYPAIKKESFETTAAKDYQQMRLKTIYNTGSSTFDFRWFRSDLKEGHAICPVFAALVKAYDDFIVSIGFSFMAPGTIIYPHIGFTDSVLRGHLGIEVPDGNCCIRVDKDYKK